MPQGDHASTGSLFIGPESFLPLVSQIIEAPSQSVRLTGMILGEVQFYIPYFPFYASKVCQDFQLFNGKRCRFCGTGRGVVQDGKMEGEILLA
jgi:hypothetical protein